MQEQDIKRGHFKNIESGKLKDMMEEIFGSVEEDGEKIIVHYGALAPLTTWIKDKSTLCVDTQMNTDVDEDTAMETRKRYNLFLDKSTGFNSKQRRERLQKKAKEGTD
ncbi:MAG: DUF5611 family protein [Thermoplasmata archaeon]|nr:MAG: DUF5611 family protein [Thermoplasmata archaeon]